MNTNNNLWDENKNILLNPINYKHEEIVKCDITNETNLNVEKNLLNDITQKKSGIYKIINKVNGKYYVGSSKDIEHRWQEHKNELNKNKHYNDYLQSAWNKYGERSFEFTIVEFTENRDLLTVEQKYLTELKTQQNKCYNLNFDAYGGDISEYSKQKIRESNLGRKASVEVKKKLSESHKGIRLSEQTKEKLRIFNKGKILTEEHKRKIGKANSGKKYSLEIKKRMSEIRKGIYSGNKNPAYDSTIYNFYNKILNIHRKCTCYELYTEFNLKNTGVSRLKNDHVKSYKGWIISQNKD